MMMTDLKIIVPFFEQFFSGPVGIWIKIRLNPKFSNPQLFPIVHSPHIELDGSIYRKLLLWLHHRLWPQQ
jgi:hypothetical protein